MLSATQQLVMLAGNVVALVGGGALFVRWLRGWLMKQVAHPVNELTATVNAMKEDIASLETRTTDAHHRIDQILIGRTNA